MQKIAFYFQKILFFLEIDMKRINIWPMLFNISSRSSSFKSSLAPSTYISSFIIRQIIWLTMIHPPNITNNNSHLHQMWEYSCSIMMSKIVSYFARAWNFWQHFFITIWKIKQFNHTQLISWVLCPVNYFHPRLVHMQW